MKKQKNKELKELTKAEEEVMQLLWKLEKAFVKEIVKELPEPRPAYNTVSTIVRILQDKGFVGHESFGKAHRYYPLVSKEEYTGFLMSKVKTNYFSGSAKKLVSFFLEKENIDIKEMDEILKAMKKGQS